MMWETSTLRTLANEDLGTLAEYDPLTDDRGAPDPVYGRVKTSARTTDTA